MIERIPTLCKSVDDLLDGGLVTGTITQLFGEKALGKSIFSHQVACSAVTGGHSAGRFRPSIRAFCRRQTRAPALPRPVGAVGSAQSPARRLSLCANEQ